MSQNPAIPAPATALIEQLGLEPLPEEGGLYRQNHQDEHSTAIYYLLAGEEFSALHRLASPEVYHFYAGDPLQLAIIHPDGRVEEPVLGLDVAAGQRPQLVVPGGCWHGSSTAGDWSLVGTTMAPGFTWEEFELANRADLSAQFPHATELITRYTQNS